MGIDSVASSDEREMILRFGFSGSLFDEKSEPRIQTLNLLKLLGMPPELTKITEINAWAQKNLKRQGERWEEQSTRFDALKPTIKPLLTELGFMSGNSPHFETYQGAIVHGALLPRVRLRLDYLIQQWTNGIRFSDLFFFTGLRPLIPTEKETPSLETEADMVKYVWETSKVPEDMRKDVKIHFICAPMKKDPQTGLMARPTTDDTVQWWLKEYQPTGRYLAISNGPYIPRQDLVVRTFAPGCLLETVGQPTSNLEKMANIVDEVASTIYQTLKYAEKQKI